MSRRVPESRHAVVASRLFRPEPAAASFRLGAVVDALLEHGDRVTVLTTRYAGARSEQRPRLRVRRARVLRNRDGFVRGYLSYLSFDLPLAFRLLAVRRPDVVLVEPPPTTGAVAAVVAALRRIPLVYYAADVWSDAAAVAGAPRPVVALLRAVERRVLRSARTVLAVNLGVAERVRELGARKPVIVGNGVDTAVFRPVESRAEELPPTFVYAGTSSEFQGSGIFVDALERLHTEHPDARLVIVGGGTDSQELAARAERLPPGALTVLSRRSPAETRDLLAGATAAVASIVPGIGYDFALPTKIYAAAASGTPVIFAGPAGPAAAAVIDSGHGAAVGWDAAAVAQAMSAAIATPLSADERRGLHQWADRVGSLRAVAERAVAALDDATGDRGGRAR